jgi:hypothetical protein
VRTLPNPEANLRSNARNGSNEDAPSFGIIPPPPSLDWISPASGEIEFGLNPDPNHVLFNISYSSANLNSVELWIGGTSKGTLNSSPA